MHNAPAFGMLSMPRVPMRRTSREYQVYQYGSALAAADRMLELRELLPGSIQAIDYERLHMASSYQDRAYHPVSERRLENLDEYRFLCDAFSAAAEQVDPAYFQVWWLYRIRKVRYADTDYSASQARRIVRQVDSDVMTELVRHDLLVGYAGRDMLEAGQGPKARGVRVWVNPLAFEA